ncbi:MAG: SseB family protein [gamma proteobacterium symbiont of Lucinoma myriamae]|nr:SseB family protein [gamma proteobacterium symbiont of Lucinoma myriamae]MCU7818803.1 SseB family protein [gamma proteobacterium symbiont of Lucinoma myriamae]MCU7832829.1 SseB family protein [gamma proteobacterium symbiont of Lucinoma myriamae]
MSTFVAENELEKKLIQAQNGEIEGEEFLKEMLDMQVFMPIMDKHSIGGFQESKEATPLSVKDEDGTEMVILFTSPERAKVFVKDYPGFDGGLLEDFKWVIEKIGGGYGVILNPGFEVGLELEANMLEQMTKQ